MILKTANANGQTSWNTNCAMRNNTFKNPQADVFNYREKLEQAPDTAALQYALRAKQNKRA